MRIEITQEQQAMISSLLQRRDMAQGHLDLVVAAVVAGHGVTPDTQVVGMEEGALILQDGPEEADDAD